MLLPALELKPYIFSFIRPRKQYTGEIGHVIPYIPAYHEDTEILTPRSGFEFKDSFMLCLRKLSYYIILV